MKVLDLFSGIGGFSLGLEAAGMETVAFCEKDSFCRKVLQQHWPDVPVYEDVRALDGRAYRGSVDVVCGGFPCQPFSVAGLKQGKADDRHLWPEMLRIISECRPRWVIGENVSGFINMALDDVSSDLENEGYEVRTFVLPACSVDARHRRDRVWVVGHAISEHGWRGSDRRGGAGLEVDGDILDEAGRQQIPNSTDRSGADVANTDDIRLEKHGLSKPTQPSEAGQGAQVVADTNGQGELQQGGTEREVRGRAGNGSEEGNPMAHPYNQGLQGREEARNTEGKGTATVEQSTRLGELGGGGDWPLEPAVRRMAHGVPNRVDRIKALGNAVVPRLVQVIGELVVQVDASRGTLYASHNSGSSREPS